VVEGASLAGERRLLTRLADLAEAVRGLERPALLIIGEVASLADLDAALGAGDQSNTSVLGAGA
jgi:siroheme synthase